MIDVNVNNPMELRMAGIQVLAEALGPVGFARFVQQMENGCGDYTKEKYEQPEMAMDELDRELRRYI
ncbi:MAG: hypothetical protein IJ812_09625 [Schwartzia sp.]|nr:hypothetical protein [Schwartzia sp. (in: firmicutes)]MBR1760193.1 hypothetical protein [Schwartzia sp. (in: firmicutes)]MBR1886653.1 hypothetical protein [Schwartzia sp. (in: firmicutes)]